MIDFISEKSPDLVINAAAYTAVDDCETHFDEAYAVNALGPKNLAIACKSIDIPLVHISTDYVFDGMAHRPYGTDDTRNSFKRILISISFFVLHGCMAFMGTIL